MITWLSFWRDILLISSAADVPLTIWILKIKEKEIAVLLNLPTSRAAVQALNREWCVFEITLNLRLLAESHPIQWPYTFINGFDRSLRVIFAKAR